jgi:hypothetical protein
MVMTSHSFDRNENTPAIRSALNVGTTTNAWPCPFCGAQSLLLSYGDLSADRDRVEVYCDNGYCDAREIIMLITRGEGAGDRADVIAIQAVDEGTRAEQEAQGVEFLEDADGNVISRSTSFSTHVRDDDGTRRREYRMRPTRVTVEPT